jgi:periplasmic divalent cation tolerance protein
MRGDDVVVMLTSVGTEEQGIDVGEALVVRGQAACVNMVPSVRSIYRWKGKVCEDTEFVLIIKTLARHFKGVADTIREINSYELPEILSFSVRDAEERFCNWIVKGVAKKPGGVKKSSRRKPVISKRRKRAVQVRK